MPKLAANISMMFTEQPFLDRIQAAANAGFAAVEFLFPYEHTTQEISAQLSAHKIKNVLFNMPPGDWAAGERGIAALPSRQDEFRAGLAKAIAYAKVLGTPNIHAMAGLLSAASDVAECRAIFIENLKYACAECAPHNITVLIEPINTRDMPGYFLNYQDQAHAIRAEVGAFNLKVQMDFYHVQIMEGDIATTFRKYQPHIGHVQIAGVPDRHEPDLGEVNYAYLFSLLDELGYDGWVGCEYRPAKETADGLGWVKTLQL
ncbi:2-oxo-tetronate isomerase [Pusillimonas sp. ANT_WB101]|uniref:2-oxo-tetronate isomerase n=1 Tax=Pusillimonas sp. ANT_WB101 TaxID=2597356 RepID=UPI0011EFCBF7|nr:2-oxo-tetronate isomerase [Pusillimonas sp. ANT_WB101]KAA0910517.1 hydroxypyruvate isomerase family protein [Pusillimonas sp. ANT_WB101]